MEHLPRILTALEPVEEHGGVLAAEAARLDRLGYSRRGVLAANACDGVIEAILGRRGSQPVRVLFAHPASADHPVDTLQNLGRAQRLMSVVATGLHG